MKSRQLIEIGCPKALLKRAQKTCVAAQQSGLKKQALHAAITEVIRYPHKHLSDEIFGELATKITEYETAQSRFVRREEPAPWRQWGEDLQDTAIQQLRNACDLPVAVQGALMPDAHQGYGLPIGGVLATKDSVIPYAVGVDIACRVKMTVMDMPVTALDEKRDELKNALIRETAFGIGAKFKRKRSHGVLDQDWSVSPITQQYKDKAWSQLGSSGSGNHFVEYGVLEITGDGLALEPGKYLAILSHSGSRGTGASVCQHYSRLAMDSHPELPDDMRHLAWLDLDSEEGQEYWDAMNLMGDYASANHHCIHEEMHKSLGTEPILDIENHHNFAWKETHFGEEVIVHRKGATPAGEGVLGLIPGTMAHPAYVVRGLGHADSLDSAAHGAGRVMSRTRAKKVIDKKEWGRILKEKGVELLSAGIDEAPGVYKDINEVMEYQSDLVEPLAQFHPKMVRMAKAGERPED
jgi:tRNA-splicing ligase RtcB